MTKDIKPMEGILIPALNNRLEVAKKWTEKNYIDQAKKSIESYKSEESNLVTADVSEASRKRYEFPSWIVFSNTETFKAKMPELGELVIKGKGKDDDTKGEMIEACYSYLKEKAELAEFSQMAKHWYILTGFVAAYVSHQQDGYELNEPVAEGESEVNENTTFVYTYDDPKVFLLDPMCTYYSPDSKYATDGSGVPYYFYKKTLHPDEINEIYGVEVEADSKIDAEDEKKKNGTANEENTRTQVYFYCGDLALINSKLNDSEPGQEKFSYGDKYRVVFTKNKLLHVEKIKDIGLRLAKWYGSPSDFFGFGIGKIARTAQIEKQIRRGQEVRMADLQAFPKYDVPQGVEDADINNLHDPRIGVVVRRPPGQGNEIKIIQAGQISPVVRDAIQSVDRDIQQTIGLLDISQGAQKSSIVQTATGQSIFAESGEQRVNNANRPYQKFVKHLIIDCLKSAQENWDTQKELSVYGEDGDYVRSQPVTKESLKDIDFDTDIDLDFESPGVNRDKISQDAIALFDKVSEKQLPYVDEVELFKWMVKVGFKSKNPERFIKKDLGQMPPEIADTNLNTGL